MKWHIPGVIGGEISSNRVALDFLHGTKLQFGLFEIATPTLIQTKDAVGKVIIAIDSTNTATFAPVRVKFIGFDTEPFLAQPGNGQTPEQQKRAQKEQMVRMALVMGFWWGMNFAADKFQGDIELGFNQPWARAQFGINNGKATAMDGDYQLGYRARVGVWKLNWRYSQQSSTLINGELPRLRVQSDMNQYRFGGCNTSVLNDWAFVTCNGIDWDGDKATPQRKDPVPEQKPANDAGKAKKESWLDKILPF